MRAEYCGDFSLNSRSMLKTTASALKSVPSWNFTPFLSLKVHFVGSPLFTSQLSARPGMRPDGLSPCVMSQLMSES